MFKLAAIALTAMVLLAFATPPCQAQATSQMGALVPGAKLRLAWAPSTIGRTVGTATEVTSTGFVFQSVTGDSARQVAFSALGGLEVSSGRKSNWGKGALIGLIGGAVIGYVATPRGNSDIDARPLVALAGGLGGSLLGFLVGASVTSERWTAVPMR